MLWRQWWWQLSSKRETLRQYWFTVGPPSTTLAQHWTSIASTSRVCWVRRLTNIELALPQRLEFDGYDGGPTLNQHCLNVSRLLGNCHHHWRQSQHQSLNPLAAKLFNLNFHPLEIVSRWRDPQLQVSENYSGLTKWMSAVFKYCWFMPHFIFNMFKRWYLLC